MLDRRASGILLHPTSLPGPHGIGSIGAPARRFLRLLRAMGQSAWQILPLGPTGYGDSPYQSSSAFAGNPLLLDLNGLRRDGLFPRGQPAPRPAFPAERVDYGRVIAHRAQMLRRAASAFPRAASPALRRAHARFVERERHWLDDFALFDALKAAHGGRPWTAWHAPLARRQPAALRRARRDLADAIARRTCIQFLFDRQWRALRRQARRHGIRLVGDFPLFVAHDSADVWACPEAFRLDHAGRPTVVAGVPPDYFSPTGQRWGNPVYAWNRHAGDGYAWWIARVRRALDLADAVRIDHFRGLEAYWEIPADKPTAEHGRWVPGPGMALIDALRAALGDVPLIAEDLGLITPAVHALREAAGFPGMRVLPFLLDDLLADPGRVFEACPEATVFYTGTHDNDTLCGWLDKLARGRSETRKAARRLAAIFAAGAEPLHRCLIRGVLGSRARLAMTPMQDLLGLGSEARMNTPGREQGNWQWRMAPDAPSEDAIAWMRNATRAAGRMPG